MSLRVYFELEMILLTKIDNTKIEVNLMICWKEKNKVTQSDEFGHFQDGMVVDGNTKLIRLKLQGHMFSHIFSKTLGDSLSNNVFTRIYIFLIS